MGKKSREIHNKKVRKNYLPGSVIAFKWTACAVYLICFVFTLLTVASTRTGIAYMTRKYVDSVTINNKYFEFYENNNFTNEMCMELLEGETVKDITAKVMADRFSTLFDDNLDYEYDKDYCERVISEEIKRIAENNELIIDDGILSSLASYTCDICGITTMIRYKTPVAYRTAIFEANEENYADFEGAFAELTFLTSPVFPIILFIMYVFVVAIMCFVCNKSNRDKIPFLICDTVLYPSILGLGISFGGLVGIPGRVVFIDYLFTIALGLSLIGVILGCITLIVTKKIANKLSF